MEAPREAVVLADNKRDAIADAPGAWKLMSRGNRVRVRLCQPDAGNPEVQVLAGPLPEADILDRHDGYFFADCP